MGIVKNDEIKGYREGEEIVCSECVTPAFANTCNEEQIIQDNDIKEGEETWYCDRCKEQL